MENYMVGRRIIIFMILEYYTVNEVDNQKNKKELESLTNEELLSELGRLY